MSSIQPSSGAPMPPGAAVGPIANDPAVQAQIAEVQAQLDQVNAQLGGGQPTGYSPAIDPGMIGMQGTALVESLERNRALTEAPGMTPMGSVEGGGPSGGTSRLGDLIDQARIRRDIDEQMGELGGASGGGGTGEPHLGGTQPGDADKFADQMLQQAAAAAGVPASDLDDLREMAGTDPAGPDAGGIGRSIGDARGEVTPYAGGASIQTGLYEGGGSVQPAGGRIDEGYGRMLDATLPGDVDTGGSVGGAVGGAGSATEVETYFLNTMHQLIEASGREAGASDAELTAAHTDFEAAAMAPGAELPRTKAEADELLANYAASSGSAEQGSEPAGPAVATA